MSEPRPNPAHTRKRAHPAGHAPNRGRPRPSSDFAVGVLTLALAVLYLARLIPQAAHARLYMDEPFHAHVAEWILHHHALPVALPEFYSGEPYFYPPLFHLVGAAWSAVMGAAALPFLNLALTAVLFALLWALPVPNLDAAPRRWTMLLVLANGAMTLSALQLYAETLTMLLAVASVLLLLRWRATGARRDAVWLGAITGLGIDTKLFFAPAFAGFLGAVAIVEWIRGRRARAWDLVLAIGIAFVAWLPVAIRNILLF